jgi:hypothetical protein
MVITLLVEVKIIPYASTIRFVLKSLAFCMFLYNKKNLIIKQGLSKQLFNLKFDLQQRYSGYDIDNRAASSTENEFVSAVCWKKSLNQPSNTIIAGNSRGIIKILELV